MTASLDDLGVAVEALKAHFGAGGTVGIPEGHTVHYGWACDPCKIGPVETVSPRNAWTKARQHNQVDHLGAEVAGTWTYSMPAADAEPGQP